MLSAAAKGGRHSHTTPMMGSAQ
jgi:hypothetical protein